MNENGCANVPQNPSKMYESQCIQLCENLDLYCGLCRELDGKFTVTIDTDDFPGEDSAHVRRFTDDSQEMAFKKALRYIMKEN